jgi:hypothetical protein
MISLQATRMLKAYQNLQSVGGHIDQLPTPDNMVEGGRWKVEGGRGDEL